MMMSTIFTGDSWNVPLIVFAIAIFAYMCLRHEGIRRDFIDYLHAREKNRHEEKKTIIEASAILSVNGFDARKIRETAQDVFGENVQAVDDVGKVLEEYGSKGPPDVLELIELIKNHIKSRRK